MKVRIRLFAGLHDLVGERELTLELRDGATVADLRDQLADGYPALAPLLPATVCAVDEEYVAPDHRLREGDDVALIPPVSGGENGPGSENKERRTGVPEEKAMGRGPRVESRDEAIAVAVTGEPLDAEKLAALVRRDESGAVVMFQGVARNNSEGRRVVALEYDAYPEMAVRKLREVAGDARERWEINGIAIEHRIGRLAVGEASLLVAVSSPHRRQAFEACQYAVDRIKQTVPIWKKEVWDDGEGTWVAGHTIDLPEGIEA